METIESGKFVELLYDLYTVGRDGKETLVHQVEADDPESIIFGVTPGIVKPLEQAIAGRHKGDRFDVYANADEAFGPHDPEQVVHVARERFEIDGKFDDRKVVIGNYTMMYTADGYPIAGKVIDITDKDVVMDFNHPLAGKDVHLVGHISLVRDATPDELNPRCCGRSGCCGDDSAKGECGSSGCCGGCQ